MNKKVSGEMILDALNSRYRCLQEPSADLHQAYDRRYLTSLRVYGTREDDEPQSPQTLGQNLIDPHILKKKITAALSAISFRDPHVLVQFWSPVTFRKRCRLTNLDQPFGIGVVNEALYKYRLESEQRMFAVDGEHIEELGGLPGRVYCQKLPEWSLDIQGLPTSQNIKDSTACHNINGYISLPVLDPASGCCVGVLELITLSKHVDYAFEVIEISKALKEQDLKTANAFEEPSFCELPSEDWEIQIAKINDILKVMCDTHNLPLAQTWELSPLSSHVLHEKSIQKSCSSFNSRCIGKVCMSTAGLPFYVREQSMWEFHEACMKQHLEKSRGVVGRALLSQGASYCENITKLSEEEYPLVHNACKSGLGGCFAIYLRGVEGKNDYILEFFIPLEIKDGIDSYVLNLVQELKLKIADASGFEMGDISSMEVIRPPSVVNNISSMTEVNTPNGIIPHPFVTNVATIACGAYANVSMQRTRDKGNDVGEPSNRLIRNIKRKRDSLTMEAVEKQFGQPMDEAIKSLEVSRSTLKRFLRDHNIPRWPMSKLSDRSAYSNQHLPVSKVTKRSACVPYLDDPQLRPIVTMEAFEKQVGQPTDEAIKSLGGACVPYLDDPQLHPIVMEAVKQVRQPLDEAIKSLGGALVPYLDDPRLLSIGTMEAVENQVGQPMDEVIKSLGGKSADLSIGISALSEQIVPLMDEAIKSLGVSWSTLMRFLLDHNMPRRPMSKLSNRSACVTDSKQHFLEQVSKRSVGVFLFLRKRDLPSIIPPRSGRVHVMDLEVFKSIKLSVKESFSVWIHSSGEFSFSTAVDSLVIENTTNTEQATNNVDPLFARTAMAHQNMFDSTTYMEQATNNVEPLMDVDLDKVADLNCVDAFPRLSGADFIDDQGSFLKMAGCSSGSVHDYPMEPDGIENALKEMGKWPEGDWPPPIGSGDMYVFGANPSDYDFSN